MAKFLLLHTYNPKLAVSEGQTDLMKGIQKTFTKDTYCIASWPI